MESASSGLTAGLALAADILGEPFPDFTDKTAIGALSRYISNGSAGDFQPMNINFGIIAPLDERIRSKAERYTAVSLRSLSIIDNITTQSNLFKEEYKCEL